MAVIHRPTPARRPSIGRVVSAALAAFLGATGGAWADGAASGQAGCTLVPVPQVIAQIYDGVADDPDHAAPEVLRLEDVSGDGLADLVMVTRLQTEGGSGDAAAVSFRMGGREGLCDLPHEMVLDAGAGPIAISATPNADGLPDFAVSYQRNQRETGPEGMSDVTVPATMRFHYDAASFGYIAQPLDRPAEDGAATGGAD